VVQKDKKEPIKAQHITLINTPSVNHTSTRSIWNASAFSKLWVAPRKIANASTHSMLRLWGNVRISSW